MEEPELESAAEREVHFLEPQEVTIWRDRFGQLRLKLSDGREFRDVHLSLAFPLTQSNRMLILRDTELAEIGVVDEYLSIDDQSRQVLLEELEKAYFMPRILRILSADEKLGHGLGTFEVETDRGPRTIQVQLHERLRLLPGGRVMLQDVDANRYDIPHFADLDVRSRALLENYL